MHHTDCGMTDLAPYPELLAEYFEIPQGELASKSVSDPVGSVRMDVETILDNIHGINFLVSGLVYDVATGRVDVVVAPTPLRPA
jgi:carbonic anhydrase